MWHVIIVSADGSFHREEEETKPTEATLSYWEMFHRLELDVGEKPTIKRAVVVNIFET